MSTTARGFRAGALTGALAALGLGLPACRSLPSYARPQATVTAAAAYTATDSIRYRRLSRADFRAPAPPAAVAQHASSFGAYTCAAVLPDGQPEVVFEPSEKPGRVVARLANAAFHAEMDRGCSWWNERRSIFAPAYILQHEQIHFALFELRARILSAQVERERMVTRSPESAAERLRQRYRSLLDQASAEIIRQNTEFDEDTSGRYEPERQAQWLAWVEAELAKTGGP